LFTLIWSTIFVLGVLIFFHELGHFLVAKWSGIRVEKFSLGFPPNIIKKQWGETEYAIGMIPLGGFVKMAGDNPAEELSGNPWEFMSKPVWKRFLVVFAGPFINFLLAIVVLIGLFYFRGIEVEGAYVNEVSEGKPADLAGIRSGDQILTVDGNEIRFFEELSLYIYAKVEEPVNVTWKRGDQIFSENITTYKGTINLPNKDTTVGMIGVSHLKKYRPLGLIDASVEGFNRTVFYSKMIFFFIGGFFTGDTNPDEVGGPVAIAQIAKRAAMDGFGTLMAFLAMLSVNLGILNLLPIPVFDGGHIMFLLFEKIKGSPPSLKTRVIAQQIGIAFILILVIFVTFNDITR